MSRVLLIVAAVLILGGVAMLALLVPAASSTFYTVCLAAISILCVLMGVGLLLALYLGRDNDPNFFLYDTKSARNISESDLTFERINSRMGYYMTMISSSQEQLWVKNVLASNHVRFGQNGVYKPLVAYKMLYDLIELDRQETWELFTGAEVDVISTLCRVLSSCGEVDMSNTLMDAYEGAESVDDIEYARDFIMGNAKYIRRRMRDYVLKNIEEFY